MCFQSPQNWSKYKKNKFCDRYMTFYLTYKTFLIWEEIKNVSNIAIKMMRVAIIALKHLHLTFKIYKLSTIARMCLRLIFSIYKCINISMNCISVSLFILSHHNFWRYQGNAFLIMINSSEKRFIDHHKIA